MKICGNCRTSAYGGKCPDCDTYWSGGIGYTTVWPSGPLDFARDMQGIAARAGFPRDAISLRSLSIPSPSTRTPGG